MKGTRNCFIRKSQSLSKSDSASKCPKKNGYREELVPFLGNCIEVVTKHYTYKNGMCDGHACVVMLLLDVEVIKVPAKSRNYPLPIIDHLWVVLDNDWEAPSNANNGLWLKGFVYEYKNGGKKNIGLRVVSTKAYRPTMV